MIGLIGLVAFDLVEKNLPVGLFNTLIFSVLIFSSVNKFMKLLNIKESTREQLYNWIPIIALVSAASVFTSMMFVAGTCVCQQNYATPGMTFSHFTINTAWQRSGYENLCPNKQSVCHFYATLPEDALTQAYITFHINPGSCTNSNCNPNFEFKLENEPDSSWRYYNITQGEYQMPREEYSQRNVYSVLLEDLNPNSLYVFRVSDPSWNNNNYEVFSYKTFDVNKMNLLVGGDVGNNIATFKMNDNTVKNLDFDMILVGGDIAYDNNVATCYRAWDYFLKNMPYDKFNTVTGTTRIVPMLLAVGNHDMG